MTLESTAVTIADQIKRQEFVEVLAHHDADGIAAGSIICHAMLRAGIRFRLRIRQEVSKADLTGESAHLLCDIGSGMEDLPPEVMVIDHHIPRFEGEFHANPRLAGIDGDRELSASGTAFIVAQQMGDNLDLAGLAICGIIGDGQEIVGKNLEIFNEAIANGVINPGRGITLPGRDMTERWYMATSPYLDGISGEEQHVADLIDGTKDRAAVGKQKTDALLSRVILDAAPATTLAGLGMIYGDTYQLQREVIEDGHTLAAVIDACGKTGNGGIGATLCLRSSQNLEKAWEIARQHRVNIIDAVKAAKPVEGMSGVYEVKEATIASDVADIFARDRVGSPAVLVFARSGNKCWISARASRGTPVELGPIVRQIASSCGGNGGGHNLRAGATIPCDNMQSFAKSWHEAVAS